MVGTSLTLLYPPHETCELTRRAERDAGLAPGSLRSPGLQSYTPATDDQMSASLRLAICRRVTGAIPSSSSGRRRPTTLTLPPLMLRATRTIGSSVSSAPAFGAW